MQRHGFPGGRASRIIADFGTELRPTLSLDSEPLKVQEKLAAEYRGRWEAAEIVKAQGLLTDRAATNAQRFYRLREW